MAAAEARAVWQRTANRYFVQEDAKRAPKLACCQSSSSTKQIDAGSPGVADAPDNPDIGFMPLNKNWLYSNLPDDTSWWLKVQPNFGYQKGLTCEQLEVEMEALRAGFVKPSSKVSEEQTSDERGVTHYEGNKNSEVPLTHHGISTVCTTKYHKVRKQNVDEPDCKTTQEFLELMDTRESYEFVEIDSVRCPTKKSNEGDFDPESPWIGNGKGEPWWRTTDKDDLAFLVAEKSLYYMENCDLPPPRKMQIRRNPNACSPDFKKVEASSLNWKAEADLISNPVVHEQGSSDYGGASVKKVQTPVVSDQSLSYRTIHKDISETQGVHESDSCKAQLMEALRHSQTRAREAEMAAKQANAEKEHILKLFFRQASQLFAYKQWFQLLQLEALYYQIKNIDQPISTLFPVALPWTRNRGRKLRKGWQKTAKGKRGKQNRPKNDTAKCAVAFALGLGLVGAGLLLGWTVGWMLF